MTKNALNFTLYLILAFFLTDYSSAKRGGRGGADDSSLKFRKCNLRLEYWDETKEPTIVAVAKIRGAGELSNKIVGTIKLEQQLYQRPTRITGEIVGLEVSSRHGLFIDTYGRFLCDTTGGHYNPLGSSHGKSESCWRHVGDLEPIATNSSGGAKFLQWEQRVQLQGPYSVIGRSFVILMRAEDNEDENSLRIACGVIGLARNTSFRVSKFVTPSPDDDGFLAIYVGLGFILIGACAIIYQARSEIKNDKNRYKFPTDVLERRHKQLIRERHAKQH